MLLVLSFSDWCCHLVGYTLSLSHHVRLTGTLASSAVSCWPFVYVLGRNRRYNCLRMRVVLYENVNDDGDLSYWV